MSTRSGLTFLFYATFLCTICFSLDPNVVSNVRRRSTNANICRNIEIWSPSDKDVALLKNCSVVEGYVRIMQFNAKSVSDINITFPSLKEITGYLMLFRVTGLDSLGDMFPNLSVIRGNILFENYAVVVFEMFELKTLSLTSLTDVLKGDIFIASNVNLCFVDTVDWNLIAPGNRKHYISGNKNPNECPVCSANCTKSVLGKYSCWNSHECQRCPSSCPKNCRASGECCHPSCLSGCTGPGVENCFSCKNYRFQDTCVQACPNDTYIYSGWRCILESECYDFPKSLNNKFWKPHEGQCLLDCPPGYHEQEIYIYSQKRLQCQKCDGGTCRKECRGALISNIEDSKKMRGCTIIRGGIMISLSGHGKNIVPELEKNLNGIEEIIDYLKISDSYQLTSLNFLKNLRSIHGNKRYKSKYSLIVVGNKNLELLWDFYNKGSGLKINGSVYFRSNPKLCLNKIQELLFAANVSLSESFYPSLTNGVKNVCDLTELVVRVENITSTSAWVFWTPFEFHDLRKLMGYVIYIKEAPFKNITVFDGRNECGGGDWKVFDVSFFDCCADNYTLKGLKPFTRYAFYVKTVTVNADFGAESVITYFSSLPGFPSIPLALSADTNSSSEIMITWAPPLFPNGIISHYLVSVQMVVDIFATIDHCEEKGSVIIPNNNSRFIESDSGFNDYTVDTKQIQYESNELSDEQRKRLNDIHFENKLQNYIYIKRPRWKRFAVISNEEEQNISTIIIPESSFQNTSFNNAEYETSHEVILRNKIVNGNGFYVTNLKHFTRYRVEVQACRKLMKEEHYNNTDDYCSKKSVELVKTYPSLIADTINDVFPLLEVSTKIAGTITLKWDEPDDPNGNVLSYTVEYRRSGYSSVTECINQKQFLKFGKSYILKNLSPGNYSVRVRASSISGPGPYTSAKYFFIKDDASIHTYIYLILGTLLFILPPAVAYCICYLRKTEKNKLFISVNPEYTHKLYVPDAWEIPRNQVDLIKEIGQGSFGMVYEGILNNKPCAVKTVNAQASDNEKKEFLNEASVMKAFDTFHVVKLLGVVSFSEPVYVIMELMPNGDLKSFLRLHRPDTCDPQIRPPSLRRLLQMSAEIADGMAYLSAKKYVHRDLAARNCMVTEILTVKIGDFGMARDIYVGDYYRKGTRGLMPVRWMAPESLRDGIFLSVSDVWSYGIVLYEMVTLAAQPYQGLTNDQVLRYVMDGGVMERPENCPDKMYNLMRKCWRQTPGNRPSFLDIVYMLHEDVSLNFHALSFYDSEEGKEHRMNAEANADPSKTVQ